MDTSQEPKYCILDDEGREIPDGMIAKRVNNGTPVPIPDNEPIMIFRAKDIRSVQALTVYAEICKNPAHQRIVMQRVQDFKKFQNEHPELVKEPD